MKKYLFIDFDNTMMATEQFAVPSLIERFNALYGDKIEAPLTLEIFRENFHGQARETLCENLSKHFGIPVDYEALYEHREWRMMQHLQKVKEEQGGVPMAPGIVSALSALRDDRGVVPSFVSNNCIQRALAAMRFSDNGQGDALAALFGTRFFEAGDVQKPRPDVYLRAMEQVGATPGDSAAVEDSLTGIAAAVAAGMTVYGFTGFVQDKAAAAEKMMAAGCAGVFDDWSDFAGLYLADDLDRKSSSPARKQASPK
jgi:beta-phosphoglucomutase-like phosphatase (HAD superfamily)